MNQTQSQKQSPDYKVFAVKVLILLGLILASVIILLARQLVLAAVLGTGIAVLTGPAVHFISKWCRFPRTLSALVVYACMLLAASGILYATYWVASEQIVQVIKVLPNAYDRIDESLSSLRQAIPGVSSSPEDSLLSTQSILDMGKDLVSFLGKGLKMGITNFGGFILALVLSFYIAINPRFYVRQLRLIFGFDKASYYSEVLDKAGQTLRTWFFTQALDMLIVGALTAIGLAIVGFKYWLVVGLLATALCFIPYIGIIIVAGISLLICLANDPDQILPVALVLIVVQQLEGNLILPYLMKQNIQLPEAPLIFFLTFMGYFFGVLGIFMAPPLMAVLIVFINAFTGKNTEKILVEND